MKNTYVVMNSKGQVFAGVSTISGRAMWFDCGGDISHMSDVEALRRKRDTRWLALAQRSDASAYWETL